MNKTEAKLQAKMVIDFSQKCPDQKGRLIGYFAETENKIEGATKLSLGLVKGASDLFYIRPDGRMTGIEVKAPNSRHNVQHLLEQCEWLIKVPVVGWFVDSVKMFWDVIYGCDPGISPYRVKEYLHSLTTQSVSWDEVRKKCI